MTFEGLQQNQESAPKKIASPELRRGLMEAGSVQSYDGKKQEIRSDKRIVQAEKITEEEITDKFFPREDADTEDINLRAAFGALVEESAVSWEELKSVKSEAKNAIKVVTKRYLEFWRTTDGSATERAKRKDEMRAELQSLVRGGIQ